MKRNSRNFGRDMTKPPKWVCAQCRLRSAWAKKAWVFSYPLSTQRRLWSDWASTQSDQSSLSAWRKLGSLATHWAHSEDSDQSGRMPRLIRVFAGHTVILLVLSWGGSNIWAISWLLQTVIILLDPTVPIPIKFWYKGKLHVWCTKSRNMYVKLTSVLDCGFICHSQETAVLSTPSWVISGFNYCTALK